MRTNWYKHCCNSAETCSTYSPFYDFKVNRRNGYYALDYYSKDGRLLDTIEVGTGREIYLILRGMRFILWTHSKMPF